MIAEHKEEKHQLLFSVRRSVRYHDRRVGFYNRYHVLASIAAVAFGSSAIYTMLQMRTAWALTDLLAIAFLAALVLVAITAQKARLHSDLKARFIRLEKALIKHDKSANGLQELAAKRLDIEADEPPVLRVLDTLCHNEMLRADGYDKDEFKKVNWYQRLFADVVDIQEYKIS